MQTLPLPEPSAGLEAYEAEREARFEFNWRTRVNFEIAMKARAERAASVAHLPTKLDIENTSRCNFACSMCAVSTWPKGKRAEDMTLERFRHLIDEQYGLVEIKLNGLGEALLQGDDYFEMIRYARERRIWVRMTTNASLLHLRDNYRKLVDSGVNEIDISVDGVDAATFEGIRIQSDWNRVRSNIKLLNSYAHEQGRGFTKMWTLVQRANVHDLERHVPLAHALGFRHLVFSCSLHGWGDDALAERNRGEMVSLSRARAEHLVALGSVHGIRVAFWDVAEKFSPENLCPWPFDRAVVTSDSRTVPCCMIGDPDKFEIGKGKTFLEAWASDEYRDFRQAHIEGRIPRVCKGCYKEGV